MPSTSCPNSEQEHILKTVKKATKYIALLDNLFLYKDKLPNGIDKFYAWNTLFSQQHNPQVYQSEQPAEIRLDKLIYDLTFALKQETKYLPKLLVEKVDCPPGIMSEVIVCNVNQMIRLLVTAVLRMVDGDHLKTEYIKLQIHPSHLQIDKGDSIHYPDTLLTLYPSIALLFSNAKVAYDEIPKVRSCYKHISYNDIAPVKSNRMASNYIDLQKERMESIIDAHYGYLECPKHNKNALLLVFPINIDIICNQKMHPLPIHDVQLESLIMLKKEADSMMVLMKFHDFICKSSKNINKEIIRETLLLLRKRFGNRQHISGVFLYVRAIKIAKIITKWVPHCADYIYASLLYKLVPYTGLSLAYIKDNYNTTVHRLVQNILSIETYHDIEALLSNTNKAPS